MDLWVYPSRPKVPRWIWIRRINSAQTFSYFIPGQPFRRPLCLSLLQQTGPRIYGWIFHSCSKISNSIFALTVAMHILLWNLAALFFLNSIILFLLPLRQPAQRFHFQQTFIKLLNWKPSVSSFRLIYFPFNITERVTKTTFFVIMGMIKLKSGKVKIFGGGRKN